MTVLRRARRWAGLVRSLVVYWRPGRQRGLRRLYRPFVEPGELVFDVGAHLGDRTAAFSGLGARVVSLEPQPHVFAWLRRLVGHRPGVVPEKRAVGAREGVLRLWISAATPTVSTVSEEWRDQLPASNPGFRAVRWEESVEVEVTTLDRLIEEYGEPVFCKIDVEGHEAEVLAGLGRPLAALSVEFVAGSLGVALECVRHLQALADYRYNVVAGESRSYLLDDWVSSGEIASWFTSGAGGASSGDLYARRVSTSDDPPQNPHRP